MINITLFCSSRMVTIGIMRDFFKNGWDAVVQVSKERGGDDCLN